MMETETIVYFHPASEQMYKNNAAKKHWWQDAVLRERSLTAAKTGGFYAGGLSGAAFLL